MMEWLKAQERVKAALDEKRWAHTQAVIALAQELAKIHGLDTEKARWAALLHDCARRMPQECWAEWIAIKPEWFDRMVLANPLLMHAPVGALVAQREYGVADRDVLLAIRYHTTGRAGMRPLEKAVYLADCACEGRVYPGVGAIRTAASCDLDRGMAMALRASMEYLLAGGRPIHPLTLAAWNTLQPMGYPPPQPDKGVAL